MEGAPATSSSGGGGGGGTGGPAPFILKTYNMVDDSSTDEIVSWSSNNNSFVVWNPQELARLLLPTYFKHNNFSSFIRQLNTYGFRKIDPERWEFGNEDFVKDQKHMLKNIYRRKPVHSHSHPPGSMVDSERADFDEQLEKLSREKAACEATIISYEQERSALKLQLEDMLQRVDYMEKRQENLVTFFGKAVQNPTFVQYLTEKIESLDISTYKKKRRLPQTDQSNTYSEYSHMVDSSSSSRQEFGNIFHQDFSNKLRLLSPAISDINMVSHSTQSSDEAGDSSQKKITEGDPRDARTRTEEISFTSETLELSDTVTFPYRGPVNKSLRLHSLQAGLSLPEEADAHISCLLNLTLASSSLPVSKSLYQDRIPQDGHELSNSTGFKIDVNVIESEPRFSTGNRDIGEQNTKLSNLKEIPNNNKDAAVAQIRVNDVFWEQFLTEKPGSEENEDASSNNTVNLYGEQDDRRLVHRISRKDRNIEQLTL